MGTEFIFYLSGSFLIRSLIKPLIRALFVAAHYVPLLYAEAALSFSETFE